MLQYGRTWGQFAKEDRRTDTARFHLYELSKIVKFMEVECTMLVARGWGKGEMELLCNGYKVSVTQDEKALDICCTMLYLS